MSIIHDALKKAEASKAQKPGDATADPAADLIAKMTPAKPKKNVSPRLVVLVSGLALLAVAVMIFGKPLIKRFRRSAPDVALAPQNSGVPVVDPAANNPQTEVPVVVSQVPENPIEAEKADAEKKQKEAEKLGNEFLSLFEKENYVEALKTMEALIVLRPTEAVVYNDYGVLLKRLGRTREALEAYNKALALSPDYVEALNNAAAIYIADRNYAEAKALLQKALDKRPDYLDAMLNIAIAYEKNDELEKAKVWYGDFLRKSEGRVDKKIRLHIEERLASLSEQ